MRLPPRVRIVNPNTDRRVTAWLAAEARRVAPPGILIEAVNAASGLEALVRSRNRRLPGGGRAPKGDGHRPHASSSEATA